MSHHLRNSVEQHGAALVLDAVQAVGKTPVDFQCLGATALAFGAHKFHGPRGIGGLLLKRGVKLPPFLEGGHQENGRRAGTEPVPLIAGMAKALQLWASDSAGSLRQNPHAARSVAAGTHHTLQSGCRAWRECRSTGEYAEYRVSGDSRRSDAGESASGRSCLFARQHLCQRFCSGSTVTAGNGTGSGSLQIVCAVFAGSIRIPLMKSLKQRTGLRPW